MKIYKNLYWFIISPANLFNAWNVFKKDKRNKPDVLEFEINLERNIFNLYRNLKNETYKHGKYEGFWIHDPKVRRIHKAIVRDRVLHHAIFKVLNPIFEPTFIADSFSCRAGKGTHKGMKRTARMIEMVSENNTKRCYILKCDIRKFFDSVDHNTLIGILEKRIKDEKVMNLLREIIGSFTTNGSNLFERKGVPIGNLTSQLFANVYMNEFDQFVKHQLKVRHYVRYTDDFVIVSSDEAYLEDLIPAIQDFLKNRLLLELHPKKVSITKHNRGVDFLGYNILPKHIKLKTKTKKRILRKLRENIGRYQRGEVSEITLNSSLQSYLGVLSHANAHNFSVNLKNYFWFTKNN